MSVKILTEHHLECLSPKGGCTGSSESTLVKVSHCRKSHVTAQMQPGNEPVQDKRLKHPQDIVIFNRVAICRAHFTKRTYEYVQCILPFYLSKLRFI